MSEKQNKNITNKIVTVILILAVALCLYVVLQVLCNGYVSIAGFSVFRVVTGSMEPEISIGALLISKEVDIAELEVGDIVCFRSQESDMLGKVITHRVVDILTGDGTIYLETKGDANPVADGYYVSQRYLVGEVIAYTGKENLLSDVMSFLTSQVGFLICIILPCMLISGMILRDCVGNIRAELNAAMDELIEESEQEKKYQYFTQEEYMEMYQRIRRELMEELGLLPMPPQENVQEPASEHAGRVEEMKLDAQG